MKATEFDLTKPFATILVTALSLPKNGSEAVYNDDEIKRAARSLYEAAHGRFVETQIGPITIAPAVAAVLKTVPFFLKTRDKFVALAEAKTSFRRGRATVSTGFGGGTWSRQTKSTRLTQSDNSSGRLSRGLALLEFMAGKLGAPGCWPDPMHPTEFCRYVPRAMPHALERWENEGGKTLRV